MEILDSALARRFDEVVEYTLPDTAVARAIIERRLGKLKLGSKSWSGLEPSNKRHRPQRRHEINCGSYLSLVNQKSYAGDRICIADITKVI